SGRKRFAYPGGWVQHDRIHDVVLVIRATLHVGEETPSIPNYRAVEVYTVVARLKRSPGRSIRLSCIERLVVETEIGSSVIPVGSRLGDDLNSRKSYLRELGRERIRINANHLNRFFWWNTASFAE